MKTFVLLAVVIGVAQAVSLAMLSQDDDWEAFKAEYGKSYGDEVEEKFRKMIFMETLQRIAKHNKGQHSYKLGLNQFSDMLPTEFNAIMNGFRPYPRNQTARRVMASSFTENDNDVPDQMDWRDQGAVTAVKDQGHCGSCWAFSTTGALEGQNFRKTGNLVSLSEQNLVDCTQGDPYDNNGCHGGNTAQAFQYINDIGGIDTEDSYPYQGTDDNSCQYQQSNSGAGDSGSTRVSEGDEDALKQAVATIGPISVCIDADDNFKDYQNGVYEDSDCSSTNSNHCVLVVGYGTDDNGQDYWQVKNSWGEGWGEQGYIRMARNDNNLCGIANYALYPNNN